jgi:SAM-dependent methyltransferase
MPSRTSPTPPPADCTSMLDEAYRSLWWNEDFVDLLARRVRLADAEDVLDVGCGAGHWSAVIAPHLAATARLTGIDAEQSLLERARARLSPRLGARQLELLHGRAEQLPFDDGTFDLVTCQTVLIHVPDPLAVLREMRRVVRPGGTILVVEPNNLAGQLVPHSRAPAPGDLAYWLDRVGFWLTCVQGRIALGHGDLALGERVPELLREASFAEVRAWLADKVALVHPPYGDDEQQALLESIRDLYERADYPFPRELGRRYFLAGGGSPEDFDAMWQQRRDDQARFLELEREGGVSATVGQLLYVVAATAA